MSVVVNYRAVRRSFRMLGSAIGSALVGFLPSGTGAVPRTAQDKMRDFVSILDFIPVAEHAAIAARTSTYNCHSAIVTAIASVTHGPVSTWYVSGPAIYFPPGKYICNSTIDLKKSVRLYSDGSGLPWDATAELKFPAGVTGITINRYNTIAGGVEVTPTTAADATTLEGLRIIGTTGGALTHGVWMRAKALVRNCFIENFSGNGINIVATAGGGGATEGNANSFRIEGGRSTGNGGHGLYVTGADANAGTVIALDCSYNTGWGIYDSSFLGNTYVGCHVDGNVDGAYRSDNQNARNLLLNCYSESGQPASTLTPPSMAIGGLHAAGLTGYWLSGNSSFPTLSALSISNKNGSGSVSLGSPNSGAIGNELLTFSGTGSDFGFASLNATGRIFWNWANLAASVFLEFYDRNTATIANGFARTPQNAFGDAVPIGLPSGYLGKGMLARVEAAAAPVSGDWLRGDIVWNESPSAGGPPGWMCVVSGTPGTWKAMANLAP